MLSALLALSLCAAPAPTRLPLDEEVHVATSMLLTLDLFSLGRAEGASRPKSLLVAGSLTLAAGAGKEFLWDYELHRGDPSWKDFGADAAGVALGLAVSYAVDRIFFGGGR